MNGKLLCGLGSGFCIKDNSLLLGSYGIQKFPCPSGFLISSSQVLFFLLLFWPSELSVSGPCSHSAWRGCHLEFCLPPCHMALGALLLGYHLTGPAVAGPALPHVPAPPVSELGIWKCPAWEVWGFNSIESTPMKGSC